MKKIINGKVYNTETAEYIGGFYKGGTSISDFNYIEQNIYRSKNGQYFLYILGWANTEYSTNYWNSSSEGEYMGLMSMEDIATWLEENSLWLWEKSIDSILSVIEFPEG